MWVMVVVVWPLVSSSFLNPCGASLCKMSIMSWVREIHSLFLSTLESSKNEQKRTKTLGFTNSNGARSHIGWRVERNTPYKSVKTSP